MCSSVPCTLLLLGQIIAALSVCSGEEPKPVFQQELAGKTDVNQARRHPSYQVFAAQTRLSEMRAFNRVLTVGGNSSLDFDNPTQASTQGMNASAELLQVPMEFLRAIVQRLSTNHELKGEELAREFRIAIIDYRYLSERWARYRPPAGEESVKIEAMKCLQTADLQRSWQMYIGLQKPKPPEGLRITSTSSVTN